jgi:hypothetical protein
MKTISLSTEQVELIKQTLANAYGMAQVYHQKTGMPYYKKVENEASEALGVFCKANFESWEKEMFG